MINFKILKNFLFCNGWKNVKNNISGGGIGEIVLCRMYMYFEYVWSRYEVVGFVFEW